MLLAPFFVYTVNNIMEQKDFIISEIERLGIALQNLASKFFGTRKPEDSIEILNIAKNDMDGLQYLSFDELEKTDNQILILKIQSYYGINNELIHDLSSMLIEIAKAKKEIGDLQAYEKIKQLALILRNNPA